MNSLSKAVVLACTCIAVWAAPAFAAPANDNFGQAKPIQPGTAYPGETNVDAGTEPNEPVGHRTVWYAFTPPASGSYTFNTCGAPGTLDTVVSLYRGSGLANLREVASNDDACANSGSEVTTPLNGGFTYFLRVGGFLDGNQGQFTLTVSAATPLPTPANDAFANATTITTDATYANQTNVGATTEGNEPQFASPADAAGRTVWYALTPTITGNYTILTCGTDPVIDTLVRVYTGSAAASAVPVAGGAGDDGCTADAFIGNTLMTVKLQAGTLYHLQVGGYPSQVSGFSMGKFTLKLTGVTPPNDSFANAEQLTGPSPSAAFDLTGATNEGEAEPGHGGQAFTRTLWYRWTAPASGLTLARCYDPSDVIGVYTGAALDGSLAKVVDGECDQQFTATAGTEYRIAVAGPADGPGRLRIVPGGFSAPAAVSFGTQETGTLGPIVPVTFTNSAAVTAFTVPPRLTGTNAGDFPIVGGTTCTRGQVPGQSTCVVNVRFSPSATGPSAAVLSITAGYAGFFQAPVALSGTGTAATPDTPGQTGATGPPGAAGAVGAAGPVGPIGAAGAAGAAGSPGAAGVPGAAGAGGAQGPQGAAGPAGPTGAAGQAGAAGQPGPQGRPAKAKCKAKKPKSKKLKARCKVTTARREVH